MPTPKLDLSQLHRIKRECLDTLETAFNIGYTEAEKSKVSDDFRLVMIVVKQAEVINKLIEKNNKLAKLVVGEQPPQTTRDGIILL